jgi:hypothetical protein
MPPGRRAHPQWTVAGAGQAESSDACVCFARVSIFGEFFALLDSAPAIRPQFDRVMEAPTGEDG